MRFAWRRAVRGSIVLALLVSTAVPAAEAATVSGAAPLPISDMAIAGGSTAGRPEGTQASVLRQRAHRQGAHSGSRTGHHRAHRRTSRQGS